MLKCLWMALEVFGAAVAFGAAVWLLRWVLWPFVWVVNKYWNWVANGPVESEFVQLLLAVFPVVGLVLALLAFLVCLVGGL